MVEVENQDLEAKVALLENEKDYVREMADGIRERNRQLSVQVDAIRFFKKLPSSLTDVLELIGHLHPDKIVFTDEAKSAAKNSSFADLAIGWDCIWSMATVLHELYFDRGLNAGDIKQAFRELTGFDLAMTETGMTKDNKKLMALRKIEYNGQIIDISPHVKYGVKEPRCLRVHYCAHHGESRLIVGHCGDHLQTSGTRRRR